MGDSSQSSSLVFSIRIVSIDYYMSSPIPGLDSFQGYFILPFFFFSKSSSSCTLLIISLIMQLTFLLLFSPFCNYCRLLWEVYLYFLYFCLSLNNSLSFKFKADIFGLIYLFIFFYV